MDGQPINLTICQDCKVNPATYGDGITWSRCSACQLANNKDKGVEQVQEAPQGEGFKHEIKEGLTSIILPIYLLNYSLFHYTGNCIGSVREHTPEGEYELVVVDNGSPLKAPELTSYYAHRVIVNEENLGVTKAWNQGIRMSIGEYIVLLNNDVQVFDGWLEDMRAALDAGIDLVMAHPMYSLTEPFARAVESAAVRRGDRKLDALEKDFSCVMFKRSLVEEIGLFDERFFSYCSDSDFFRRLEEAGKKWKMLDTVATSHLSDATGYSMAETSEIMNKDKESFAEKWENKPAIATPRPQRDNLVRVIDGGDPIYLLKDQEYHHISDPETLKALGFDFGDERAITQDEFKPYKRGEDISLKNYENYTA